MRDEKKHRGRKAKQVSMAGPKPFMASAKKPSPDNKPMKPTGSAKSRSGARKKLDGIRI